MSGHMPLVVAPDRKDLVFVMRRASAERARLNAAAPLQHAELIACKQFLEDMHTQTPEWTIAESQKRHEAVCAAIAAATGEQP